MKQRRILRKKEVRHRTGYSDTTIWRRERQGRFPARVQLSEHSVGWYEDEIDAWIRDRIRGGCRQVKSTAPPRQEDDVEDARGR
jgi:prophage regulatory protein